MGTTPVHPLINRRRFSLPPRLITSPAAVKFKATGNVCVIQVSIAAIGATPTTNQRYTVNVPVTAGPVCRSGSVSLRLRDRYMEPIGSRVTKVTLPGPTGPKSAAQGNAATTTDKPINHGSVRTASVRRSDLL